MMIVMMILMMMMMMLMMVGLLVCWFVRWPNDSQQLRKRHCYPPRRFLVALEQKHEQERKDAKHKKTPNNPKKERPTS